VPAGASFPHLGHFTVPPCTVPQLGQNFDVGGTGWPHFTHGIAAACVAPHVGQNLEPAGIIAPHAVHGTLPPPAAGAAPGGPACCLRFMESIIM